ISVLLNAVLISLRLLNSCSQEKDQPTPQSDESGEERQNLRKANKPAWYARVLKSLKFFEKTKTTPFTKRGKYRIYYNRFFLFCQCRQRKKINNYKKIPKSHSILVEGISK
ncbi:MAG: hypothetical protein ACI4UF_06595, partial [Thermoguttaceae bacterium]